MRQRKVLLLFMVFALATLLSGCELPEELNQAWKESAHIQLSTNITERIFMPLVYCLIPIALFYGLLAISSGKRNTTLSWFLILIGVGLIPLSIPMLTQLSMDVFWPADLTIFEVIDRMGWKFPLPEGDVNPFTLVAAISFTSTTLPLIHQAWQYMVTLIIITCLVTTIFTRSTKPLTIAASAVVGWLIFPVLFSGLTIIMESARPEGAIAGRVFSTVMNYNMVYIFVLTFLMILTYIVLPLIAALFAPAYTISETFEKVDQKVEWEKLLALAGAGKVAAPESVYSSGGNPNQPRGYLGSGRDNGNGNGGNGNGPGSPHNPNGEGFQTESPESDNGDLNENPDEIVEGDYLVMNSDGDENPPETSDKTVGLKALETDEESSSSKQEIYNNTQQYLDNEPNEDSLSAYDELEFPDDKPDELPDELNEEVEEFQPQTETHLFANQDNISEVPDEGDKDNLAPDELQLENLPEEEVVSNQFEERSFEQIDPESVTTREDLDEEFELEEDENPHELSVRNIADEVKDRMQQGPPLATISRDTHLLEGYASPLSGVNLPEVPDETGTNPDELTLPKED